MARYGRAVEADLAFRGWDLAELWRKRRWRFLLNLIDHLPRDSAFSEAVTADEEVAEYVDTVEAAERSPRVSEFGPTEELLAAAVDRLGHLVMATIAMHGRKPPNIPAWPRPVTAAQRVALRRRWEAHEALVRRVLPNKRGG